MKGRPHGWTRTPGACPLIASLARWSACNTGRGSCGSAVPVVGASRQTRQARIVRKRSSNGSIRSALPEFARDLVRSGVVLGRGIALLAFVKHGLLQGMVAEDQGIGTIVRLQQRHWIALARAFSDDVDTGSLQKMRPNQKSRALIRFHRISALDFHFHAVFCNQHARMFN